MPVEPAEPVEPDESVPQRGAAAAGAPGYRIALILLGILVTPVVLAAPTLGSGAGWSRTVSTVLVGSAILLVVAAVTLSIGEHARQPTYEIVRFPFGRQGAKAITVLLAVSVFGWVSVTANGFGMSAGRLLTELFGVTIPLPVLVAVGCAIFVGATAFGFEVLSRVAQIAVPVIAALLGLLVYQALSSGLPFTDPADPQRWGVAVSSVVGTGIVLVVTAADFGSFTRSRRQALLGAALAFAVAYPLLYLAGALPSAITGAGGLIDAMGAIASVLPAVVLLVFASITANAGNMFQGTLAVATLAPGVRRWQITVALGIAAAVVGSLDVAAWLPNFLLFLGIAAPPVAGICIADFALSRRGGYDAAELERGPAVRLGTFAVWALGCVLGYLTAYDVVTVTGISSIDSLLASAVLYLALDAASRASRPGESPVSPGKSPDPTR